MEGISKECVMCKRLLGAAYCGGFVGDPANSIRLEVAVLDTREKTKF